MKDLGPDTKMALNGWWLPTSARLGGVPVPHDALQELGILLLDGTFVFGSDLGRFAIDSNTRPPAIDFFATRGPNRGRFVPGIVAYERDMLRVCFDLSGATRPAAFDAPSGSRCFLASYRRAAPIRCGIDTEAIRGGWRDVMQDQRREEQPAAGST